MLSRIVAQRVSYTTKVCAHKIKDLGVAHGCRAAAGLPPPSLAGRPLDNRRAMVSWERMAQRNQETRTLRLSHGHWPCAPDTVQSPSWMHVYICIEMRSAADRG